MDFPLSLCEHDFHNCQFVRCVSVSRKRARREKKKECAQLSTQLYIKTMMFRGVSNDCGNFPAFKPFSSCKKKKIDLLLYLRPSIFKQDTFLSEFNFP